MFSLKPEDFPSEIEYTRAVIRHVRRMHSIDDRMENARRETISTNFTTRNVFPTALSCPLVADDGEAQDHYYIKALVPVCKTIFEQEFSPSNPAVKPKFKRVGDPELLKDQTVFGVLTARNFAG